MRVDLIKRVLLGAFYALLGGWASFAITFAASAFAFQVVEAASEEKGRLGLFDGTQAALGAIFMSAIIGIPLMSIVVLPLAAVLGFVVIRLDLRSSKKLLLIGATIRPTCWLSFGLVFGASPFDAFRDPFFFHMLPFFVVSGIGGIWLAKLAWFANRTFDDALG